MTTPMIVPPPNETSDPLELRREQQAAWHLREDPRYVVVDLGLDGLPEVERDRGWTVREGGEIIAHASSSTSQATLQKMTTGWLAIDAAMHAPPPPDPAVERMTVCAFLCDEPGCIASIGPRDVNDRFGYEDDKDAGENARTEYDWQIGDYGQPDYCEDHRKDQR